MSKRSKTDLIIHNSAGEQSSKAARRKEHMRFYLSQTRRSINQIHTADTGGSQLSYNLCRAAQDVSQQSQIPTEIPLPF